MDSILLFKDSGKRAVLHPSREKYLLASSLFTNPGAAGSSGMGLAAGISEHLGSSRKTKFLILAVIASLSSIWFLCRTYDFVPRVSLHHLYPRPRSRLIESD